MSKYQVVVGNVGTIYDGNRKREALTLYKSNVSLSVHGYGRHKGEAVTLLVDGEIDKEHEGYQHLYENGEPWELESVIAHRRAKDPGFCPACGKEIGAGPLADLAKARLVVYDDGRDHRIHIPRKCVECGFEWSDVYQIRGAKLEEDR
jgi:hypothetical protein